MPVLADRGLSNAAEDADEDEDRPLCVLKDPPGDVPLLPLLILCSLLPAAVTVCDLLTPAAFLLP